MPRKVTELKPETPEERQKRHDNHQLEVQISKARADAKRRFGRNGGVELDRYCPQPDIRCRVGVYQSVVLKPAHCRDQKKEVVRSLRVLGVGATWGEAFRDSERNRHADKEIDASKKAA